MSDKRFDLSTKRLVGLDPLGWTRWVTGQTVRDCTLLDSGFQFVAREGDVLVRAVSPEFGPFLIPNEIQLRYTAAVPRRLCAYAALAREKYRLPTYPVLVVLLPPSEKVEIASRFEFTVGGLVARQDFRVIKLWEVDVALAFQVGSLLPLAPLMRGGAEPEVITRAIAQLDLGEEGPELRPLLGVFATLVLGPERVAELLRWDVAVLEAIQESPLFRDAFAASEQRGEQRGRKQAIREMATNMLQLGMSLEEVARIAEMTPDALQQLLNETDA